MRALQQTGFAIVLFVRERMAALRYINKVVLVTGGSKGIGEGIVRDFGKNQFFYKTSFMATQLCAVNKSLYL